MEFERIADKKRADFIIASIRNRVLAGGEILDIGCGNGIISRTVGVAGYNVLGIDVSEKTISQAIEDNNLPNVQFKVMGAEELNKESKKFDAVICSEVLEHLHHPDKLLAVIHSLLKDEGILIVTVPNGHGPRELFVTRPVQRMQQTNGAVWKLLLKIKNSAGYTGTTIQSSADDLSHIQFFTRKSLCSLALTAHFRISIIKPSNFIEQVFPFSLIMRKSHALQRFDCHLAEVLPLNFTSGFMSVWKKL
ncbi:MAG: methyltransferase domain-containing protein [Chitinophagaceae bacterium]|nr:methyltransferase domain-containing protein [Chitinophagaceae bacterium]